MHGEMHKMSYTEFSLYLGSYDIEFVETSQYEARQTYLPLGILQVERWRSLSTDLIYHLR